MFPRVNNDTRNTYIDKRNTWLLKPIKRKKNVFNKCNILCNKI